MHRVNDYNRCTLLTTNEQHKHILHIIQHVHRYTTPNNCATTIHSIESFVWLSASRRGLHPNNWQQSIQTYTRRVYSHSSTFDITLLHSVINKQILTSFSRKVNKNKESHLLSFALLHITTQQYQIDELLNPHVGVTVHITLHTHTHVFNCIPTQPTKPTNSIAVYKPISQ